MKFKNRTTSEILSPSEIDQKYCQTNGCRGCPYDKEPDKTCDENVMDHIDEIADAMGYDLFLDPVTDIPTSSSSVDNIPTAPDGTPIENADTPTTESSAPSPLAQILGVLDDEPFRVPGLGGRFRIHNGLRQRLASGVWTRCHDETELIRILSAKDSLIHLPMLTEPELAILKPIPNAKWISRDVGDATIGVGIWAKEPLYDAVGIHYSADWKHLLSWFTSSLFPSLRPGDCFSLEDIL